MDRYKAVLDSLDTPVILWEGKLDPSNDPSNFDLVCVYNNTDRVGPEVGTNIKDHLHNSELDYLHMYHAVVQTGEAQKVTHNNTDITLKRVYDNTYCETHYHKCDNMYLLCSVSHKIRQPLTNIIGVMSVVDEFNLTDKEKKYMNVVKKSSYKIVELANDIIDIVKLENNQVNLDIASCSLKEVVQGAYDIVSADIKKNRLKFSYKLATNLPDTVYIDQTKLQQMIVSLISNSIKSTKFGSISLEITLFSPDDTFGCPFDYTIPGSNRYNILFKIRDTGSGINDKYIKMVNKILNIDKSVKDDIDSHMNSGFSLLICRYLANLMGGNLWYKTELDIGTVFYFNTVCEGVAFHKPPQ